MGSAALAMAVGFLFEETPAHVVSAWMPSWNEPALAFSRAVGFTEAGRRPRGGVHGGAFYSEVAFDLLRAEWASGRGSRHAA
jgi:RimJ/RimL family protein N-acetyltransferase